MDSVTRDPLRDQSSTGGPGDKSPVHLLHVVAVIHGKKVGSCLRGRNAVALIKLIEGGVSGCSTAEHPAPSWSGYVERLRKRGFEIVTKMESHGRPFPGRHARYFLLTKIVSWAWVPAGGPTNGRKRVRNRPDGPRHTSSATKARKARRRPR